MAIISPVVLHSKTQRSPSGDLLPSITVLTFSAVGAGDYTLPVNLESVKSVWVSKTINETSAYYLPSYRAADDVADPPLYLKGDVDTSTGADYVQLTPTVGTVILPTTTAGFLSTAAVPGYLSVKHAGATGGQVFTITLTY